MKLITRLTMLTFVAVALTASCRADTLVGTTVTGSFDFGSGNFFTPNTTTVGPGLEFTYADSTNQISADFDTLSLEIADNALFPQANFPETFVFTDSAFTGLSLVAGLYNYPTAFTSSLVGDTLTITLPAEIVGAGTYTADFTFVPVAATPEPNAAILAFSGVLLVGMTVAMRRRQQFLQ